jgi:type I restriction enzyme, S subunit
MTISAIADIVHPVRRANPIQLGATKINYIDIASIDRETKHVSVPSYIDASSAPSRARQLLAADDVLVSTVRPNLNAVAMVPSHLNGSIGSTGFCVLRADTTRLRPDYLFYYSQTRTFVSHLTRVANGASYPAVSDDDVLETTIPLPPIDEQSRLVQLLKNADRLRHMRRYALQMCDELLPVLFLKRFGDPKHNAAGFPLRRLEELIQPARPISYGILMPGPDITGGVPYIRVTDIQNGEIVRNNIRRTTPEIDQAYKRSRLKAGDLLLSIRGHVGRMAIVPSDLEGANIAQDSARLATVDSVEAHYVMGCLATHSMQRRMENLTRGAAVQGINLGDVKELPIPVPPLALQRQFAGTIQHHHQLRATHVEALRQSDHLFQTLLHQAFSNGQ